MALADWSKMVVMASLVAGCALRLPPPEAVELAPVPGVALPYKARVMIFAGQSDLDRNLVIQSSRYQTEETKVKDGRAVVAATRALLAKGFQQVTVDDLSIRPHLIVKVMGKAQWARLDAKMKVGCSLDVWTADGMPLGNFGNRYDSPGATDYTSELDAGYAQCLKVAVDGLLASPALARLAGTGFKEPSGPGVEAYLRSLGPIPAYH